MDSGVPLRPALVHERQGWNQHCARHSINNLLQQRGAVTKAELDGIAEELFRAERQLTSDAPLFNPNKSVLGLGNYSVGVIERALRDRGLDCSERLRVGADGVRGALPDTAAAPLVGFIVNRPSTVCFVFPVRHWLPIVRVGPGAWANLDSLRPAPLPLDLDGLHAALQHEVDRGADVLLVSRSGGGGGGGATQE